MTEIWNSAATTPAATHRVPVDRSSSSSPAHWTGQQIADVRAYIGETVNSLGSISTNQSLSLVDGRYIAATITGNVQFTFTSVPATGAAEIFLELTNAGAHTVSFAASLTWTGGTVPSLPASGVALLHLRTRDGGTTYLANMVSDEQSFDAAAVVSGTLATARLGSGTANSGTFLRGDQTWASPIGGSSGQLIYNNAGDAGGASGTYWDAVNGRLSIGAGTSPAGMLHAQASAASVIPAVLQGAASQTANLQEWRNSAGTVLAHVSTTAIRAISAGSATMWIQILPSGGSYQEIGFQLSGILPANIRHRASGAGFSFSTSVGGVQMLHTGACIGSAHTFRWSDNAAGDSGTADTALTRAASGVIGITNASTGGAALEMAEQTAPSAPGSNKVRIYAEDNGSGKTRLMAIFPTGAAQQIAIEP